MIKTMIGYRTSRIAAAVRCACILPLLLQFGCGVTKSSSGYPPGEGKGLGFAVVSLSRTGLPSRFNMLVNLRGLDNDYKQSFPVTDLFAPAEWGCSLLRTALDHSPCGLVAVIELQQGEYEFYSWEGKIGGGAGEITLHLRSTAEFSKRFRITAGQTVYLGNIHFAVSRPGIETLAFGGNEPYRMTVTDLRQRDLPVLYQKNPKLTSDSVLVNILPN
jgi:hypothetical protein